MGIGILCFGAAILALIFNVGEVTVNIFNSYVKFNSGLWGLGIRISSQGGNSGIKFQFGVMLQSIYLILTCK